MMRAAGWMAVIGLGLFALSLLPILLYAAFGPDDGNPIGLGLLMVFGTGLGALLLAAAAFTALLALVRRR